MTYNQREHFRVYLQIPLAAMCRIVGIANKPSETNYAQIALKDISLGGARMHSKLDFPLHANLLLEISFTVIEQKYKILGTIVRKTLVNSSLYEYGIKFIIADASTEQQFMKHLNIFSVRLRDTNVLGSCSFCTEEELESIYVGE
ncbi:PilZ domain-containing protein [Paenibacillus silvisoli]|uniref:PilZ domain-containing protein n=1 Tax=Paenibacillus silvisoli TaxID=3110539 RepID=UPI002804004C|nr:PilZ domain-containing protein [Paenibacillus silvisoli]